MDRQTDRRTGGEQRWISVPYGADIIIIIIEYGVEGEVIGPRKSAAAVRARERPVSRVLAAVSIVSSSDRANFQPQVSFDKPLQYPTL